MGTGVTFYIRLVSELQKSRLSRYISFGMKLCSLDGETEIFIFLGVSIPDLENSTQTTLSNDTSGKQHEANQQAATWLRHADKLQADRVQTIPVGNIPCGRIS